MKKNSSFPIGFVLSGQGSTLINLLKQIKTGQMLHVQIVAISGEQQSSGKSIANKEKIPYLELDKQDDLQKSGKKMIDFFERHQVKLIVLGGFTKKFIPPQHCTIPTINIHPSLIPAFSGQGFYGKNIHKAAIQRGVKISGLTIHVVNQDYDQGTILLQKTIPVHPSDTPESLEEKIALKEKIWYPKIIQDFAEKQIFFKHGKWISPDYSQENKTKDS